MEKNKQKILPSTIVLVVLAVVGFFLVALLFSGDRFAKKSFSQNEKNIKEQLAGDVWLSSATEKIKAGDEFDINVYINTNGNDLGVFALDFKFDKKELTINTESGDHGIDKGVDGQSFIVMSNPDDVATGHLRFSGICAQNCANGDKKNIAIIHAKAKNNLKFSNILGQVELKELANDFGKAIDFKSNDKGVILIK